MSAKCALLQRELLQPCLEVGTEFVVLQAELDRGFQEAELVARVVALALVGEAVDLFVLQEGLDAVGELELAACAGGDGLEHLEDAWGEDVAADDGVLRWGLFGLGLLDHVLDGEQARVLCVGRAVEAAVGRDGGAGDDLGAEDGGAGLLEGLHHLLHAGDVGVDDIVGQNDAEGFVADELLGLQHSVAEAERLSLAGDRNFSELGDGLGDFEQSRLVLRGEVGFKLRRATQKSCGAMGWPVSRL